MKAKRVEKFPGDLDVAGVCYWKEDEVWHLYLPGCGVGNLAGHKIIEHEDGTITATPSILLTGHEGGKQTTRHGYLTHGEWKETT